MLITATLTITPSSFRVRHPSPSIRLLSTGLFLPSSFYMAFSLCAILSRVLLLLVVVVVLLVVLVKVVVVVLPLLPRASFFLHSTNHHARLSIQQRRITSVHIDFTLLALSLSLLTLAVDSAMFLPTPQQKLLTANKSHCPLYTCAVRRFPLTSLSLFPLGAFLGDVCTGGIQLCSYNK